jgi:molybdopterin-guanine dinucleotide biosynthesis protein A
MPADHPHRSITGVILAGGRSRRMDGTDKALLPLAGQALLTHIIAALRPQVDTLILNSNRPADGYAQFGLPVIADSLPDQPGPLAGLLSALQASTSELVLSVPCDTPDLPADLVARMHAELERTGADVCSVSDGERLHAAIMLVRRSTLPALQNYLAAGQRKVQDWLRAQPHCVADFSDQPAAFSNINTPQELQALEQRFARHEC